MCIFELEIISFGVENACFDLAGFTPTLIAIFPNASFHFGFYHVLRQALQRYINEKVLIRITDKEKIKMQ